MIEGAMNSSTLASSGSIPAGPVELPPDWQAAISSILAGDFRRVLVLGAADAGKSTFCGAVLSQAAAASRRAVLLDTDPGQKQVGPPACVTLGYAAGGGAVVLSALVFIGAVEPLRGWSRLVAGSASLAAAAQAELTVINTCGLLRGPGRRLKAALISALRPDLLVAIGEKPELDAVLGDHAATAMLRLVRPPLARRKGEGERRALRRAAFHAYFDATPVWPLPIRKLHLQSEDGEALPSPGRLVALMDEDGRDLALSLVLHHDAAGSVLLRGPRPVRAVAGLRWGLLSLDQDWAEQGRVPRRGGGSGDRGRAGSGSGDEAHKPDSRESSPSTS
jgi:polynucleotide 5'-hydroxyl-kinase GRC3/NOL9